MAVAEHVAGLLDGAGATWSGPPVDSVAAGHAAAGRVAGAPAARPGPDRRRPGLRHGALPLRAGQPGRGPRRLPRPGAGHRPRRRPAPHPGHERPVPGLLLRGRGGGPGRRRDGHRPGRADPGRPGDADPAVAGGGGGPGRPVRRPRAGVARGRPGAGGRPRGGRRGRAPPLRPHRVRPAGPAPVAVAARPTPAAWPTGPSTPAPSLRLSTTVAGVAPDGAATLVGPGGLEVVRPRRGPAGHRGPRAAPAGPPGARATGPAGVFTTGQLQQWVLLAGLPVGRRAVVVGAEHVAYSAVLTLRHAGVSTVAMVTELPRHQTVPAFAWPTRLGPAGAAAHLVPGGGPARARAPRGRRRRGPGDRRRSTGSRPTPSSSPGTGCPTTNWPDGWRSPSTRPPAVPGPTGGAGRRVPAWWPPATWSIPGRRPAWPRSADGPPAVGWPTTWPRADRPVRSGHRHRGRHGGPTAGVGGAGPGRPGRPAAGRLLVRTGGVHRAPPGGGPPGRARDRAPPAPALGAPPVPRRARVDAGRRRPPTAVRSS